jgi:cupin 2 domain-containing protein
MITQNIFDEIPAALPEELFTDLLRTPNVRIERIVSRGQSSPEGFWYDQAQNEWVILVKGAARILFEDDAEPVELEQGSYLNIPAHRKHRVEWTDPNQKTVWLAVHY